jgi:hypothetical protein
MSTARRIHGEFLRLLFFLSNKQADDYFAALGYEAHKEELSIVSQKSIRESNPIRPIVPQGSLSEREVLLTIKR